LRSQLAQRLRLRSVPELRFVHDSSVERGVRLSRLIEQALGEESDEQ
jgi:ribosome-binding factor A